MDSTEELLRQAAASTLPSVRLMTVLWSDTAEAERILDSTGSQYARRQYLRSVFAMVEGMVFATKQLCGSVPGEVADPAESAMLQGVTYDLDEKGRAVTKVARLPIDREIRFAMRAYAKSVGLTYEVDASGRGWQALMKAKQVRDRLMHPKRVEDLQVSDEELKAAKETAKWFREANYELQEAMVDQIARNRGLSEAEVAEFRQFRKDELQRVLDQS